MDALTVWQPWASLIAIGAKPYEFRGWVVPKSVRGTRIAVHAGARPIRRMEVADLICRLRTSEAWSTGLHQDLALPFLERVYSNPACIPLSHVVCTAIIGAPKRGNEVAAEFGGPINDSDRDQHANWAWPLSEIRVLAPPLPAQGKQGFWRWAERHHDFPLLEGGSP